MQEIINKTKKLVKDWHIAFNVQPPTNEQESKEFWKLRQKLFQEEHDEYLTEAMKLDQNKTVLIEKADAIGDMLVIVAGTLDLIERSEEPIKIIILEMMGQLINEWVQLIYQYLNIPRNKVIKDNIDEVIEEIMRSNMSKLDNQGRSIINGVSIFDETNKTIYNIDHIVGEVIMTHEKPVGKVLKSINFVEPTLENILYKD